MMARRQACGSRAIAWLVPLRGCPSIAFAIGYYVWMGNRKDYAGQKLVADYAHHRISRVKRSVLLWCLHARERVHELFSLLICKISLTHTLCCWAKKNILDFSEMEATWCDASMNEQRSTRFILRRSLPLTSLNVPAPVSCLL